MGIITEKIDEFLFQIEEEFSKAGTSFNVLSEWYKRLKHIFMKARNQKYYHDLMECVVKYIELVVVNFSLLSHKKQITHSKNFFQKVEALIEHDHKAAFLKNVSEKIFEIVTEFDGYQGWAVIKELLKMYYNVIKDTSIELRSDAVDQLAKMWMYKLTDSISIHSDYDMQVLIIEVIILLYGKGNLNRQIGDLIPESQELSEHFIGIDPDNFDRDVRVFLNRLNQNPTSSVFSIVCDSVQLGDDYVCITPFNSMQGLWVDFNMNNCVISWYCGVGTFDVIEEDNSRAIELISILGENISRFHISVSPNDLITIKFELQHPPLNLQEKYKLMVKNCNKCSFTLKNSDGAQKLLTQVLPKVLKYTGRSSTDADIVEGKLSSAGDETLNISIPDTDILDRSILFWDRTINTSSCTFEAISVSSGSHHSKKSCPGDENLANAGRQSKRAASGRKSPSNVNFKKSRQAQALTVIFEEPTTQPGVRPNSQEADEVALVQNGSEAFYTAAEEIPATLEFDSVHIIDDDVISQTQEEQKENQYPMKPSGHGHKSGIPLKELNFYSEANVSGTESEEDIKVSASDLFSRTEQCTKPGAPVVPDVKLTSKEERAPRVSESVEVPILDECTRIQTSESIEECALDGRRRDMIVNLITSESEGSTVPQKNKKKSKKINSTKSAAPELSSDDENFVTQYKEPNRILGKVPGTVDTVKKPRQRKPSKTKIENINRDSEIIRLNYSASIEGTRNTVDRIASDTEGPSVIPNRHSKMLLPLESSGDDSIIALSSSAQPEKQNQRLHRVISCGAETVIAEKSLELGSSTKNECSFNKEVGEGTPKTSQEVGMLIEDVPSQLVISSDAQKVVEAKSNTTPQVANISLEKRKEKQRISLEKDTSGVDAFSDDEIPKPLTKLSSSRADSIIAGRSSLPLQKRKKQRSKKKRVPAETVIAEKSLKSGSIAKNESSFNKEVGGGTPRTSKEFGIVMEDVPSQLVISGDAQKVLEAKSRQRKPSKTKIKNIDRGRDIIRLNSSASIRHTVDRIASDTEDPSVIPNRHSKMLLPLESSGDNGIIALSSTAHSEKQNQRLHRVISCDAETVIAEKYLESGRISKNEGSFNNEAGKGTPGISTEVETVMEDVPSQLVISRDAQKVVGAKCNTTPQVANISLEKSKEKQGPLLQKDTSDVNAFSDDEMPKPLTKSSSRDDTIIAGMSSLPLQKRKKRRSKKKRVPAKKNKLTNRKMSSSSDSTIFARRKKTLRKLDSSQKSEALDIEMGSKTRRLKPQQDYIFEELAKLHGTSQQNEASQRSTHRTFLQDSVVEELGNNNAEIQQFEHETDFAESSVKSKTLVDELPELSQDLEEVPSKEVKRSHCDKEGDKLATDLDEPICAKTQDEKHEFAVEYSLEKSGIRKGRKREECQSTQQIKHAKKHTSDAKSHAGSKIVILSNVTLVKGRSSYQQESILGKSVHVETGVDNEDIILGTPLKSSSKMETRSKSKIYKTLKTIESVKYVESAKPACEDVDVNHEGVAGIRDDAETGTSDNHHHESLNVTITTESAVRKNMPKDQIFGQDIDKSELNASSHTATEKQIVDIQADKNEDSEQIDAGTENKEICGTQKVTAKHNVKGIKRSHVRLQHSNVDDILEVFTDEVNYHQESNIDVEHNSATQKSHISAKGKSVQSIANINAHKHANESEILSTHRAEEANEGNASKIRKNTEGAEPMDANKTRENSTIVKRIERDFDCRSEYTNTSSTISRKRTRKLLDESITWHNVPQLNENLGRTRIAERSVEKKIDVPKPAASSFKEKNWKNLTVNIHRQPQEDESPFISARNLFQDSKRKNNELQMRTAKKVRFENNMQSDKSRSVPRLGHSRESACFRVFGELLESERHKLFSDKSENQSKRTRNRTYRKKERAPPKNTPGRPRKKLDTVMRAEKVYSPSGVSSKRRKTQEIDNGNITPVEFDVASSEIAPVRSLLDEEDNAFVHDHTHKEIDGYISEIIEAPEWVADAIQCGERKQLRSSDFQGKYLLMFFYPSDFGYTVAAPEELEELSAHMETFKSLNVEVVGCCTTDENVHMEFLARKPNIVVPLIADCKMKVSMAFRMYVTEWGHNFRAAIFIDPKGKIQWRFILHNDDCTVPVDILLGLVKKHVLMHPLNI